MAQNRPRRRRYRPWREHYIPRRTKWIIALSLLGALLIGLTVTAFVKGWIELPDFSQEPVETQPPTQPPEDTVIHIVAGGDVNITDKVVSVPDYNQALQDVLPILGNGDLTLMNFEGNVYGEPYGSLHKSSPTTLLDALRSAGVDVLQVEPMTADCPLYGAPHLIITPHIAWAGVETRRRLMGIVADNLRHFIAGDPINRV